MVAQPQSQIFYDLEFYLWRLRSLPMDEWREEIFMMGSRKTLQTMLETMTSMRDDFQEYGQSIRKFLCNPPDDIDVIQYAKEHKAEIEWLNWLIIKMDKDAPYKTTHELREKTVTVWLNPTTLDKFLQILRNQLQSPTQPPQEQMAPGGLYFAQGWLGPK